MRRLAHILLATWPMLCSAQVPDTAPVASAPPAKTSSAAQGQPSFLGKDVPVLDPSSEILSWDGLRWNITNQRIFESRFEKYLNAAEETGVQDKKYRDILRAILDKLAPTRVNNKSIDEAFRLLPTASGFEIDARLCDALADAVYSAWRSQDASARLVEANAALEQERKVLEWNAKLAGQGNQMEAPPSNKDAVGEWEKQQQLKRDLTVGPYATRLAEVLALVKANQIKRELSQFQTKIEFQALIMQFFLQRRFQHVLIATRFYRAVFSDGNTKLEVGTDAKDLFAKSTGVPPTVGTLDSMANEAIRDAREGVEAYLFLVGKNELQSATKRLAEAFVIGEYLPELRTLPREEKRKALDFSQKSNQLISALDVKDYGLADRLVKEMSAVAKDFDSSKPLAAIETARTVSSMHLAKARNAAVSGDKTILETELRAATEIWPRNPALADVSGAIFQQADVQQQALADMERLISQKNYRQIFDDKVRFIAASALYPVRQEQLAGVLKNMEVIEGAIIRSTEISKRGDYAGAWENVERVFHQFPEDNKLNQMRATLTTEAADFVHALRVAQTFEEKREIGGGLAWYLKARKLYPPSEFAREGIDRLARQLMPEAYEAPRPGANQDLDQTK